jgi:hypothetical protein
MMKDEKVSYGFAQDITLYRQSEEKLRETLRELQTRNHELTTTSTRCRTTCGPRSARSRAWCRCCAKNRPGRHPALRQPHRQAGGQVGPVHPIGARPLPMLNTQVQRSIIDFEALIGECFDELKYMEGADRLRLR